MPTYFYTAVSKGGALKEGSLEGNDDKAVALRLQGLGLIPIKITNRQISSIWKAGLPWRLRKVKTKEVMFFTQELSTLVNAGLPLDRSLSICKNLSSNPALQSLVEEVLHGIKQGNTFADSLSSHPEVFSKLYVNMVRAGEASGSLPVVLDRLVEFQQSADELKSYLVSSLIYPALLALVGVASILILLNFVIPKFAQVFRDAGQSLPLPTQILLSISEFSKGYWWLLAAAVTGSYFAFKRLVSDSRGKRWWDGFRLKVFLLGDVFLKMEVSRISRTLGTLIHNSVPLIQSLGIVREITGNSVIANSISMIAEGVKKGEGVAKPMAKDNVFPSLAIHLVEVGEETGRLDAMFLELAKVYDKEVRSSVKNLIALFEPMMILVMGLVVGVVVISILLAIVSINDVPL
ncbi:MAG: type II secretion system F family protein [Terriglobia bacterium]